jgi:hypothetical protein
MAEATLMIVERDLTASEAENTRIKAKLPLRTDPLAVMEKH